VTKLFLKTSITANQVTLIDHIVGVIGCVLLSFDYWLPILGGVLLQLWILLDLVDGEVARYRRTSSLRGKHFDRLGHNIVEPLAFVSLSFHAYNKFRDVNFFVIGFLVSISLLVIEISALRREIMRMASNETKTATGQSNLKSTNKTIETLLNLYYLISDIYSVYTMSTIILFCAFLDRLTIALIFYGIAIPAMAIGEIILEVKYSHIGTLDIF